MGMQQTTEFPRVTIEGEGTTMERVRHTHDAMGVIKVVKSQGSQATLFGSALKHSQFIGIEINRAHVDRHLNADHISDVGEPPIVQLSMSEAQWAQFVSSIGNGMGTPVTLEWAPSRDVFPSPMPRLAAEPTKKTFEDEMKAAGEKASEAIIKVQKKFDEFLATGAKAPSKAQLKEMQDELRHAGSHFAGHMAFVQRQFAATMEKTVSAAKTEIETYIGNLATATGIEAIRNQTAPTLIGSDAESEGGQA